MKRLRTVLCTVLSALMLLGALSGCEAQDTPEEERFVFRAAVCDKLTSLDPAMAGDSQTEAVFCAIFENLMRMSDDGTGVAVPSPGIAKEYREIDNFDGTVDYVFTLRSTARWSDGTRVKAKDFVYAWRRLADPATGSPNQGLLSMVQGYETVLSTGDTQALAVRAENDTTFRVSLSGHYPNFLSEVCTAVPTMPLRSDAISVDRAGWAQSSTLLTNGAYTISVWAKEEFLQLRRSSQYYDARSVGPDTLRFLFAADRDAAWQLYESGRVDYVCPAPEAQVREQAQQEGFVPMSNRRTVCALYNHISDLFSNEHIRSAFDLVLDRQALASVFGAAALPGTGLVPYGINNGTGGEVTDFRTEGGVLCPADEAEYTQRVLRAETELRLGGYWNAEGFPAVTCIFPSDSDLLGVTQLAVNTWREKLGISIQMEALSREEFNQRLNSGSYDLAIDAVNVRYGDAMSFLEPYAGTDANNVLHYASTPFDLLIRVAASSGDPTARNAFLHDAEALLLDDTALSPLCFTGRTFVLREGLAGVCHDVRGVAHFSGVTHAAAEPHTAP